MKIAYLISAHNTPKHLRHLVDSLSTDAATFFIHIDKKSDIKEYLALKSDTIHFTKKRIAVYWGHFSQVEAILVLLKTAFYSNIKFDRFVLLSGADYPIKHTTYIETFFQNNKDKEYILIRNKEQLTRRLENYKPSPRYKQQVNFIRKTLVKTHLISEKRNYKKHLGKLTPYGGSSWWGLTYKAVEYILHFVNNNPKLIRFFKNTRCPDEVFFQTILGNSHFKEKAIGTLTFVDWRLGGANPAYITEKHLELFNSPELFSQYFPFAIFKQKLFARKFPDNSEKLVRALNKQLKEFDD